MLRVAQHARTRTSSLSMRGAAPGGRFFGFFGGQRGLRVVGVRRARINKDILTAISNGGNGALVSKGSPRVLLLRRARLVASRDLRRLASACPRPRSRRNPSVDMLLARIQLLGLIAATSLHVLIACLLQLHMRWSRPVAPLGMLPKLMVPSFLPRSHRRRLRVVAQCSLLQPFVRVLVHLLHSFVLTLLPLIERAVGVR